MRWESWQKIIVAGAPPPIPQIRNSDEIKRGLTMKILVTSKEETWFYSKYVEKPSDALICKWCDLVTPHSLLPGALPDFSRTSSLPPSPSSSAFPLVSIISEPSYL